MKVIRKWKRWLAVSCSHGHLANAEACKAALEMKRRWIRPGDTTLHLGDFVDLSFLMGNARRGPDSPERGNSIREDFDAGLNFVRELAPQFIFEGNHEHRLTALQRSPSAIVAHCCTSALSEIHNLAKDLRAKFIPYDIETGWHVLGGTAFGHGFMFSESAVRDHVEMLRRPVVMGHLHRVDRSPGRCIGAPVGWSIGCLADIASMGYARRMRSVTRWSHGIAYGEYLDGGDGCTVNVVSPVGGVWRLPV
jgi:hypothetical protein